MLATLCISPTFSPLFCTARPGYYFYRLDSTQLEHWDEVVLQPAIARVEAIQAGNPEVRE